MSLLDTFVDISRQEAATVTRHQPHTGGPMTPTNLWDALDATFTTLVRVSPPLQRHRVETLWQCAQRQDFIEEAQFILTVAQELVALQQGLEARDRRAGVNQDVEATA